MFRNGALVWRPKNPYSSKRFPLLIGSAEWWADDNVGLGDYEENIDSERVLSESDSDMEAERNVEKRIRVSWLNFLGVSKSKIELL